MLLLSKEDVIKHCRDCELYNMADAKIHVSIDCMSGSLDRMYKDIFSYGVFKESIKLAGFIAKAAVNRKIEQYVNNK